MARIARVATGRCLCRIVSLSAGMLLLAGVGCAEIGARSLSVWVADGDTHILADTPPRLESNTFSNERREVTLTAAINETIAFQVMLQCDQPPLGPLDLEITPLASATGDSIVPRDSLTLYRVHSVQVSDFRSWYPDHTSRPSIPTRFPDILVPWDAPRGGGPIRLSNSAAETIWVDLHVPATTEPGEFAGKLRVVSRGSNALYEADITLQVLPVAIPDQRAFPLLCRIDPRDLLSAHHDWPPTSAEETLLLPDEPAHADALELVGATMELFHSHRATPVLWASFPKYRPIDARTVSIDWTMYDALVGGWLDGSAYADRVATSHWPLPLSLNYPAAARNDGIMSPGYAALFGAYLRACHEHFTERGWAERAFVRPCPPGALTTAYVERVRRVSAMMRAQDIEARLVAHLPPKSLRGLGWVNAPEINAGEVDVWAPPATWFEPKALALEQNLGREAWLLPAYPPYSGSLAPEAPANDVRSLAWLAYRYGCDALWVEHAAEFNHPVSHEALIYPGSAYGLRDRPVPSVRLKLLRRALLDYELLALLRRHGKSALADQLAAQLVQYAGTDACREHLLSCLPAGWSDDEATFQLAREVMLQELVNLFEPTSAGQSQQTANLARWQLLLTQAAGIRIIPGGVRLVDDPEGLRARVFVGARNTTRHGVHGEWGLPTLPPGWELVEAPPLDVPAGAHRQTAMELALVGLAYNADGAYPFDVAFDTREAGEFVSRARLAVASAPRVDRPPRIDGDLSDWPLGVNNAAGDFQLCRGRRSVDEVANPYEPSMPTRAYFALDDEHLYIAVRCTLEPGHRAQWLTDSAVPLDGIVPWGQDTVEIIISPENALTGTSGDLNLIQVKPSGLLRTYRGCPTDPPVGPVEPWNARARVSVTHGTDAWTVELALPLDAFGPQAQRNRIWGLNITRLDARRGEYSSWSAARGHCYAPQALGNLILLRP